MTNLILVIDDEEGIRDSLRGILEDEGYDVITSMNAEEGLRIFDEQTPDLVLLDIWLPGMDGIEALKRMRDRRPSVPVIMISGHGTIELAVKAAKLGAYDFLEKPLALERVIITVKRALEKAALEGTLRAIKEEEEKYRIIGESPVIKHLKQQIELIAPSGSVVLITGESGSGKELVAREIHRKSQRQKGPFIEVNCAAIPRELIESELFGHEKGSFTGATERKKGKFELADGGTLFLDEIGDMSKEAQAKVLRVIETKEFQRVGGSKNIKVDVRIIAATNKDLSDEVKKGNFREDLFFRLNVIPVRVPSLRERKEDIPLLADYFLELIAQQFGKPKKSISSAAIKALLDYNWPGNVRELKNLIERLFILSSGEIITEEDIRASMGTIQTPNIQSYLRFRTLKEARDAFERDFILRKLEENNWNISKTAEAINLERTALYRKMKLLGLKEIEEQKD
ncbi:MAG: sigma-54 dependent transcriptional regulator [Thermodesulfovibrionales bacterium]|nr:sigma-54 dependent transcriptional regulator [Thermodesulfovibrionales bacterium]